MADGLSSWSREMLARRDLVATLATTTVSGAPFQVIIWYALRGDAILVNSLVGRTWPSNLLRDPRYSILVEDGDDWVSVRGTAERLDDPAQAVVDIQDMARAYHADEPEKLAEALTRFEHQERISFLLHATSVTEHPRGG